MLVKALSTLWFVTLLGRSWLSIMWVRAISNELIEASGEWRGRVYIGLREPAQSSGSASVSTTGALFAASQGRGEREVQRRYIARSGGASRGRSQRGGRGRTGVRGAEDGAGPSSASSAPRRGNRENRDQGYEPRCDYDEHDRTG